MFHLAAYSESTAALAVDDDIAAVPDPELATRAGHFILTEQYYLAGLFACGASITRARFNAPSMNDLARMQIWPVERSATIPDDPAWMDFRDNPIILPTEEEIAIQSTNDLGAATEIHNFLLWLTPERVVNQNIPAGQRITVRATGAVAGVAQAWSSVGALTFSEALKGGWYSVVGMQCFDAGTIAARLIFARGNVVAGRRLRPGCVCQEAIGNKPLMLQMGGLGVWGRFHGFEPPQLEILANATGASTQEIRLDLVYHGKQMAI